MEDATVQQREGEQAKEDKWDREQIREPEGQPGVAAEFQDNVEEAHGLNLRHHLAADAIVDLQNAVADSQLNICLKPLVCIRANRCACQFVP